MQIGQLKRREFLALAGGAAPWPLAVRAGPAAMPVIGFMSAISPDISKSLVEAFRRGLKENGFVDGENVALEFRWANGQYDRLPALAADLVSRQISVLAAVGGDPSPLAAKRATSSIPIVFAMGSDPVSAGLVQSFDRPGGNMTGITVLTNLMEPKRLGLLRDLVPGVSLIGVLLNPSFPPAVLQQQQIEEAARAINQRILIAKASTDEEIEAGFAGLAKANVGAILVGADPYYNVQRQRIVRLAERQRLPAIYQFREFTLAGGLMSYGIDLPDVHRQLGIYTAKILKGTKPRDLPVLQPTKFELVINVKTAKALGVEISDNLLSLADEVIE
jgi:putative ABC transport system substrate-binding protein